MAGGARRCRTSEPKQAVSAAQAKPSRQSWKAVRFPATQNGRDWCTAQRNKAGANRASEGMAAKLEAIFKKAAEVAPRSGPLSFPPKSLKKLKSGSSA